MEKNYLLAIILAYGPMRSEKFQIVGVIRGQDTIDIEDGVKDFLYSEFTRAERDEEILKKVGDLDCYSIIGYNIIDETMSYYEIKKNYKNGYYGNLDNAELVDKQILSFLPLKTAYEINVYEIKKESGLKDCTNVLIEVRYDDTYEPAGYRYPEIKKLIPANQEVETLENKDIIVVYTHDKNELVETKDPEIKTPWPGPSVFLFNITDYPKKDILNRVVRKHKPDMEIGLGNIYLYKFKELDLSDVEITYEEEWETVLGYSHSGPVIGRSGVKKVDSFNRLLSDVSAEVVILPDNVAKRHITTIIKNPQIKSVKVSENCKLFAMVGDTLWNKKKTKEIFNPR